MVRAIVQNRGLCRMAVQCRRNLHANRPGNRGRKGVANLTMGRGLAPMESPGIGKTLKPGDHSIGKARQAVKIAEWRVFGNC